MVLSISRYIDPFFLGKLSRLNWTVSDEIEFHFQINEFAIYRITHHNFTEREKDSFEKHLFKIATSPLKGILILEGASFYLVRRRSRKSFSEEFSEKLYFKYMKIVREAILKYKFHVIQTLDRNMTLQLLLDLQTQHYDAINIDLSQYFDDLPEFSNKKYMKIVSNVSAIAGKPFEELSPEEIISYLTESKIPGIGKATVKSLIDKLKLVSE